MDRSGPAAAESQRLAEGIFFRISADQPYAATNVRSRASPGAIAPAGGTRSGFVVKFRQDTGQE